MTFKTPILCLALLGSCVSHGDSVRDNFGSRSTFHAEQKTVDKINHQGQTLWMSDPVPVEAGRAYAGTLTLDVLSRTPGAAASVRLAMLNGDKRPIGAVSENAAGHQVLYSCGKSDFTRISPAEHGAKFMRLEVVLAGNPVQIRILNPEIKPAEPVKRFPGIYTPKAPYPDRTKTLASLEKIVPATAKTIRRNGRMTILLDGREVLLKSYKGSIDYREVAQAGINLIQTFNAGITLFWDKMSWDMSPYRGNGKFDFTRLENELLFIHDAAPDARVLLNVNIDAGPEFFERYPDSIFRNEKGELGVRQLCSFAGFGVPGPNPAKNRHWAVSYASEDYQRYVTDGLRKLAEFLKQSPAGKIVAGFGFNGGHDDQFFQWEYSAARGQGDYSPAAMKAYRLYLKEKYGTDEALRKAWNDPSVSLADAPLFSEKEWKSRRYWSNTKSGLDRKIADGRSFMTDSLAVMNNRFARTLKKAMGRDIVVGTYYSSPIWAQAGRSSLGKLSENGGIDIVFQVSAYSYMRKPGGVGASANFAIAAAHSAKLLYMQEMDHRTPRSQMTAGWNRESLGYPATFKEFRDQVCRDAGAVLACGGDGFYYFDMFDSWYNDPEALDAIRTTCKTADWVLEYRDKVSSTKTALFLDERQPLLNCDASAAAGRIAMTCRLSGVTPDIYLLDDLTKKELPDYKLWIVADPQTLTEAQLKALKEKALKRGSVLIVTGAAGALQNPEAGRSAPALAELGIKVRDRIAVASDTTEFVSDAADTLTRNCAGRLGMLDLFITSEKTLRFTSLRYTTILDDPSFKILGRWSASRQPALGVKRIPKRGTIIYSAQPDGLTPQLLHNAALEAGITPHSEPGNAVAVGNGAISIHRLAQAVQLTFPGEMELFDPATGKRIGQGKTFKIDCPLRESRLLCYRPLKKTNP